jgi:hypothetical protein
MLNFKKSVEATSGHLGSTSVASRKVGVSAHEWNWEWELLERFGGNLTAKRKCPTILGPDSKSETDGETEDIKLRIRRSCLLCKTRLD